MKQGGKNIGHPVDVASGAVYSVDKDISIPGKVYLIWDRRYSTQFLEDCLASPLGSGWTTRYFASITKKQGEYHFVTPEGELEIFLDPNDTVEIGGIVRNIGTFQELFKKGDRYVVTRWNVDNGDIESYVFKQDENGVAWKLNSIEDVTGQGLDLISDNNYRLAGIQQRLERRMLQIEYNSNNNIVAIHFIPQNKKSRVLVRYEYDENGRLIAVYDALNNVKRYEYDKSSRMIREIIKGGGIFNFSYDDQGRCINTSGPDLYDQKMFRYFDFGWTEVTNSLRQTTRFQFNSSGQVLKEIDQLGGTTQTSYDEYGRIIVKTDPLGASIFFEYDEAGNRVKIIDPLSNATVLKYNSEHLPLTLLDAAGSIWRHAYDNSNRIAVSEDPLGQSFYFSYDAHGNLSQVINPHRVSMDLFYSEHGDLLKFTDWEENTTRCTIDEFGRILKYVDPLGIQVEIDYDLLGNITEVRSKYGKIVTFQYDSAGNIVVMTNADGLISTYRYGLCNRLLKKTNTAGHTVRYVWGSEPNQLLKVINEKGEAYSFKYDTAGRIITEKGFDGKKTNFEYNATGHCIVITNGLGKSISYTRDAAGKVTEAILPDGKVEKFEYDCRGNLFSAQNSDCEVKYERDALGRVIKEHQNDYFIESKYDEVGNLVRRRTSLGHEVIYSFDRNGLVSRLNVKDRETFIFRRNTRGEEISVRLPGSIKLENKFDALGHLVQQQAISERPQFHLDSSLPPSPAIVKRNYEYDAIGNLSLLYDSNWGTTSFVNDTNGRIKKTIRNQKFYEKFTYDLSGNLDTVERRGDAKQQAIYSAGDHLLILGRTKYIYDVIGRLIKRIVDFKSEEAEETAFLWDANDRLIAVTTPDGSTWRYRYDSLGRRISKEGPSGTIRFIWDRDLIVHEIDDNEQANSWTYHPHSSLPLSKFQHNRSYSVISDHVGAPKELIDAYGEPVWMANYLTWGEIDELISSKVECQIRYPGQWNDTESGLHYNYLRYYDPRTGRYISQDPIRLLGDTNLYNYVSNPLVWTDRFGLTQDQTVYWSTKRQAKDLAQESKAFAYSRNERDFDNLVKELQQKGQIYHAGLLTPKQRVRDLLITQVYSPKVAAVVTGTIEGITSAGTSPDPVPPFGTLFNVSVGIWKRIKEFPKKIKDDNCK